MFAGATCSNQKAEEEMKLSFQPQTVMSTSLQMTIMNAIPGTYNVGYNSPLLKSSLYVYSYISLYVCCPSTI